jgi:transposase
LDIRYHELMQKVPNMDDRYDLRLKMVRYARTHGIKPAARHFQTTPRTVRQWIARYAQDARRGLVDHSRAPHHPAHKIPAELEERVVALKTRYPFMGAKHLKGEFDLPCSHVAILRVFRTHGLGTRKTPRRHRKRKDLRAIKAAWPAFAQIDIDTKHLDDLPHYWPQAQALGLPKYQYTARDVSTGWMALGYANQNTATAACCFARQVGRALREAGIDLSKTVWQSDNGSEFQGCYRQDRSRDGLEKVIADLNSQHQFIPPGRWSYNADVETVHALIETEFYDLEHFDSPWDFYQRAWGYLVYFNTARKTGSRGYKSPWDILKEKIDTPHKTLLTLPPIMTDLLIPDFVREQKVVQGEQGVYHVPWQT